MCVCVCVFALGNDFLSESLFATQFRASNLFLHAFTGVPNWNKNRSTDSRHSFGQIRCNCHLSTRSLPLQSSVFFFLNFVSIKESFQSIRWLDLPNKSNSNNKIVNWFLFIVISEDEIVVSPNRDNTVAYLLTFLFCIDHEKCHWRLDRDFLRDSSPIRSRNERQE